MTLTHLFFDVGGVLGTNGWDREQRAAAVATFELDAGEFEERHGEAVGSWESGGMSLDAYLDCTVFHRPRSFGPEAVKAFMFAQSAPWPDTIAVARDLARTGRYRMMTINNESHDLMAYRVRHFGLTDIFSAFFSSCWVGALKPSAGIYETALRVTQADPALSVFIDDRERNLEPARALGMQTVRYTDAARLREALANLAVTA